MSDKTTILEVSMESPESGLDFTLNVPAGWEPGHFGQLLGTLVGFVVRAFGEGDVQRSAAALELVLKKMKDEIQKPSAPLVEQSDRSV